MLGLVLRCILPARNSTKQESCYENEFLQRRSLALWDALQSHVAVEHESQRASSTQFEPQLSAYIIVMPMVARNKINKIKRTNFFSSQGIIHIGRTPSLHSTRYIQQTTNKLSKLSRATSPPFSQPERHNQNYPNPKACNKREQHQHVSVVVIRPEAEELHTFMSSCSRTGRGGGSPSS